MSGGWVYVLINGTMPGLAKIGKTTRDPEGRATELSGATGVPTPFVLAYQRYFSDCGAAEAYAHTLLTQQGHRESTNREFFRVSITEAINAVIGIPEAIGVGGKVEFLETGSIEEMYLSQEEINLMLTRCDELSASAKAAGDASDFDEAERLHDAWEKLNTRIDRQWSLPWIEVLKRADAAYSGTGSALKDYNEACGLYLAAAKLGSLEAYEKLGDMYRDGEGVSQDINRSVSYYRQGGKRGNYYCYLSLAKVYEENDQVENAYKCWRRFFELRSTRIRHEIEYTGKFIQQLAYASLSHMDSLLTPDVVVFIRPHKEDMRAFLLQTKAYWESRGIDTSRIVNTRFRLKIA